MLIKFFMSLNRNKFFENRQSVQRFKQRSDTCRPMFILWHSKYGFSKRILNALKFQKRKVVIYMYMLL